MSTKSGKQAIRVFFATDIHGGEVTFRKFVNAAKFYQADVLILGGDVVGKLLVPIVADGDVYRASLQGIPHTLRSEELPAFHRRLGTLGFYGVVLSAEEYTALRSDPAATEATFVQAARERLAAWVRLAEARLAPTHVRCYITGGNDDPWEVLAVLEQETGEHVIPCEGRRVDIGGGHTMVSLGFSNETPWKTPREITEAKLAEKIEEAITGVDDFSRCVFNFHCPPKDSSLDTCPMLDTSTDPPTPVTVAGQAVLFGAGSTAVRAAIHRYQPALALHGHIHECRGMARLGQTICFNPGSEYGEGLLRGVLISLQEGKVVAYQFTSG